MVIRLVVRGGRMTTHAAANFYLKKLSLTGPSKQEAEVQFSLGLNVVVGPSDTGKTFIAQCIDFMLGASKQPKRIPEAEGYDTVRIWVETVDGEVILLERSLSGGDFSLHRNGETITLGEKHSPNNDATISNLLLSLTGLTEKKILKNAQGVTRTLSFRDIAHLVIVNEEDIIVERSPVLSGQYSKRTAEISVFKLLLTGIDDSSIIGQDASQVAKAKQRGKQELLENLIEKNSRELGRLELKDLKTADVSNALVEAEQALSEVTVALLSERKSASTLEEERQAAWRNLKKVESRISVVTELQRRFELLQEQYASDLRRLEAIGEAGVRLAQMTEERCPVCGAIAEHQNQEHRQAYSSPEEVAAACIAETEKIQLLVRELHVTIVTNADELMHLMEQEQQYRLRLQTAQTVLNNELHPKIAGLVNQYHRTDQHREHLAKLAELYHRRAEFNKMLEDAKQPIRRGSTIQPQAVETDQAEDFSKAAEGLLGSWNFPNLERVVFSEVDQDLVISGRKRSSHGKGVRALTHAAFSLAILLYCRQQGRPHPGFVVIDSPLVVYREPDLVDTARRYDVKGAFYRGVASMFSLDQVIILENEDPPEGLTGANIIAFTGTDQGRFGFLPRASSPPPDPD